LGGEERGAAGWNNLLRGGDNANGWDRARADLIG